MRILFIGDVMGRSGREALARHLPLLHEKLKPDVTIVNGENAVHGKGINEKTCKGFYELGVDCITTGNHVWDQREVIPYIQSSQRLIRPINYPPGAPGRGITEVKLTDGRIIKILNAMGRLFMDDLDCPFQKVTEALEKERLGKTAQAIFVDFHAETTSEKMSFAHYFDGRVSAVVGTHTHVPTADCHVMPKGTGFQADAGMTGDYNSVIGVEKEIAIHRFVRKTPGEGMKPAQDAGTVCGTFIITNDNTGLAQSIRPVRVGPILENIIPEEK